MNQPTEQQLSMCSMSCGDMGKQGFHSLLCPLSGVDHPSRPGNTYRSQPSTATVTEAAERIQIGNTPSDEDDDNPGGMTEDEKNELRLDQLDDAEREILGSMPWCEPCQSYHHATAECIKKATEIIDITPVGMTTPEGIQRVRNAQQEWDSATHLLANTLKELLEDYVYGEGFSGDELHQLKALIGARDRKQEAFLRAVAGK